MLRSLLPRICWTRGSAHRHKPPLELGRAQGHYAADVGKPRDAHDPRAHESQLVVPPELLCPSLDLCNALSRRQAEVGLRDLEWVYSKCRFLPPAVQRSKVLASARKPELPADAYRSAF